MRMTAPRPWEAVAIFLSRRRAPPTRSRTTASGVRLAPGPENFDASALRRNRFRAAHLHDQLASPDTTRQRSVGSSKPAIHAELSIHRRDPPFDLQDPGHRGGRARRQPELHALLPYQGKRSCARTCATRSRPSVDYVQQGSPRALCRCRPTALS